MKDEVRRFLRRHALLSDGAPVLVAVSGGVDSIVLLDVLRALGHACTVAHVDHGLRGADSDADRAFVEAQAAALGVPCLVRRVPVKAHAVDGSSVQMAARELRYEALRTIAAELGIAHIALAHHQDDAQETFLIELLRGGLTTIPVRSGPFVRPLLGVGRAAIEDHARKCGLQWREDASNTDPKYLRNRVRHELLPLMATLAPGAGRVLARTLERLRAQNAYVEQGMTQQMADLGDAVPLTLVRDPVSGPLALHHWLRPLGFHPDQLERLREAVEAGHVGAMFMADDARVTVDREALLLDRAPLPPLVPFEVGEDLVVPEGAPFTLVRCGPEAVDLDAGPLVAWLEAAHLRFPLWFGPWSPGDRMRPAGLGGSKLVSDILIDAHVPRRRKERTWVMRSGGAITWLVGHRLAEGAAAANGPVLRVELQRR
ncbi:MAG: tRNA lysidine(34) synthetase TilS [Flavobacteriales bacterium]|nr:tRNA lysidine(34) synthetase TilS [Flavobacteriales bacterium]